MMRRLFAFYLVNVEKGVTTLGSVLLMLRLVMLTLPYRNGFALFGRNHDGLPDFTNLANDVLLARDRKVCYLFGCCVD